MATLLTCWTFVRRRHRSRRHALLPRGEFSSGAGRLEHPRDRHRRLQPLAMFSKCYGKCVEALGWKLSPLALRLAAFGGMVTAVHWRQERRLAGRCGDGAGYGAALMRSCDGSKIACGFAGARWSCHVLIPFLPVWDGRQHHHSPYLEGWFLAAWTGGHRSPRHLDT